MAQNTSFRKFMEIALKLHQIFALIDVDYDKVFTEDREINILGHLSEIALGLMKKNGLDYCPREKSNEGRVFEHAADSKVLIDHLVHVKSPSDIYKAAEDNQALYFVKIAHERSTDPKNPDDETKLA